MPDPRLVRALLAIAIVVATFPGAVAQEEIFAIDADHPLASDAAVDTFEEDDVVAANLTRLDVGLLVAESHDDAGIDGFHADINKVYVCVDYRESIPRTLRVFYPDDYFSPRTNGGLESLTSDHLARVAPTTAGNYTALTVYFDEPARACFALGVEAGAYFGGKGWLSEQVNRTTGIELPSLSSPAHWEYPPVTAFENDTTYRIPINESEVIVQYDTRPDPSTDRWINVPGCSDPSEQAVCRYERGNQTVLLSTQANPPPIRFKAGRDLFSSVESARNDLDAALEKLSRTVAGWFGGGS